MLGRAMVSIVELNAMTTVARNTTASTLQAPAGTSTWRVGVDVVDWLSC